MSMGRWFAALQRLAMGSRKWKAMRRGQAAAHG